MARSTDNSQFTINTHGIITDYGVMWYEYDYDAAYYDMHNVTFMFRGIRVRTLSHHDFGPRDFESSDFRIHIGGEYNPVLAGPAPR